VPNRQKISLIEDQLGSQKIGRAQLGEEGDGGFLSLLGSRFKMKDFHFWSYYLESFKHLKDIF
jgi:hypothetical protein